MRRSRKPEGEYPAWVRIPHLPPLDNSSVRDTVIDMNTFTYLLEQENLNLRIYHLHTQEVPRTLINRIRKNPETCTKKTLIAEGRVPDYYTRKYPHDIYTRLVENEFTRPDLISLLHNQKLYTNKQYTESMQQLFDAVLTDKEKER